MHSLRPPVSAKGEVHSKMLGFGKDLTTSISGRSGSGAELSTRPKSLVILGGDGVGKTAIFNQFRAYADSQMKPHPSRLVIRSASAHFAVIDVDLPASLNEICMRSVSKADAFVLVYDITDEGTFEYVERIKDFLIERKGKEFPIAFVGNKTDLPERAVKYEFADCLVSIEWEMKYVEVSATTEDTVPAILESLFSQKKVAKVAPAACDDSATVPFWGMKILPRALTDSNLLKVKSKVDQDRVKSLVDQGILPKTLRHGWFRKHLSTPNFFVRNPFLKTVSEPNDSKQAVKHANRPTLTSRLLACVKSSDRIH